MSKKSLSDEIALRIALASRALPETNPAKLLRVLDSAIGLPPTIPSLNSLNVKTLKSAMNGELSEVDAASLKESVACLKGENLDSHCMVPEPQAYMDGEMPNSIRVACASNKGEELDGHFGSCQRFLVYQIDKDEMRLIDARSAPTLSADDDRDKNAVRAECISDCNVLFIASIGGPAAAKVVKAGIHPIKQPAGGHCQDVLRELQAVIAGTPPPWLAKAMGNKHDDQIRSELSQLG